MRIVLTRQLPGTETGRLNEAYDEVHIHEEGRPLGRAELKKALSGADVAICMLTDRIDEELLGSRLRCLITYSVGIDHVDLPALRAKGIRLAHTPDILTDATADLTWALILAGARQIVPAATDVLRGGFSGFGPRLHLGKKVYGASLGVVGMGRIGSAVAERARGFGMSVYYHSRTVLPAQREKQLAARPLPLEELLGTVDILSLHCPLTPQTRHLISARELGLMKKDAMLVNTARGAVVDESALVVHLRDNPEFRAALDVYEYEPEISPGLTGLPNALCLPHIGSADFPTRRRMAGICVDEALSFAKDGTLRYEHPL